MRIIGPFAMGVLLAACTTPPIFPHEIMKDVETDTVVLMAWKDVTYDSTPANVAAQKMQLGGQITQVIRKPDKAVIVVKEHPINKYLGYGPTSVIRKDSFEFAIVLTGVPDVDMLQAGNQLAAVGTPAGAGPVVIGGMPRVLPHLLAQCLHIWMTDGYETDFGAYESSGYYPLKKQTWCHNDSEERSVASDSEDADEDSGGSENVHKHIGNLRAMADDYRKAMHEACDLFSQHHSLIRKGP